MKSQNERRMQDRDALDKLYDELIALRRKIAHNAGFENYRDYKFAAMGRFDYTPTDCYDFHASIAQEITPIINQIDAERKEKWLESHVMGWPVDVGRKRTAKTI